MPFSRTLLTVAILSFGMLQAGGAISADTKAEAKTTKPTVVIVHGAFADGSDWSRVIPHLQSKGIAVVAVQNPLRSLEDDVATTLRAIENQPGPVVLVGHSWGGMVITQAGANDKVAALVYVAAFAPDAGQSVSDLGKDYPPPEGSKHLVTDQAGYLSLSREGMRNYFAQDLPREQADVMFATQGPIQGKAFTDKVSVAAWAQKPSWYIVSEHDRMIRPELEREFAKKMGAKVTSLPTSHVPQESRPDDVAAVILDAAASVK